MSKKFSPEYDYPKVTPPSGKPFLTFDPKLPVKFVDLADTFSNYSGRGGQVLLVTENEQSITSVDLTGEFASFVHDHTKDQITDFAHTHYIADIVDFDHNHDPINDDDFYNRVSSVSSLPDGGYLLVWDDTLVSDPGFLKYRKIAKSDFLSGVSIIQDVYKTIIPQSGDSLIASGESDQVSFTADTSLLIFRGSQLGGVKTVNLDVREQLANKVYAGPVSGGASKPTFRSLIVSDMPSGYNYLDWDSAYAHSIETGNPHGLTIEDLGMSANSIENWDTAYSWGNHAGLYEDSLGNPNGDDYILSSKADGTRSWVAQQVVLISDILDWSGGKYTPYSTSQADKLRFYTYATAPTCTDRLNIGAYFYATNLYDNNSRVVNLADNQTIAGIKTFNSSPIISANSAILSFSSGTGVKKITTGGTTDFAIMPGSGKVGIGKDDPGYELDVSGDIGASGDVIAFQGNDPGSSWWDSMPYATTANVGGFKVYSSQFEMDNGFLKIKSNIFEPYLSVPDNDDYILSSKKSGVRSWIPYAKTVLTDDILAWDSLNEKYTPYSTNQAASLKFYTHATNPTGTSRLNIGAYFYATRLYEGGTRVSVTGHTHSGADITSGNLNIARMPTGGNWDISSNLSIKTNTLFVGYTDGTYDRRIGIGTNVPVSRVEINGGGQTVSAITDDGNRNSFLMLIHDSNTAGAGGALLFGNASSKAAGSIGWAAIKGILKDGSGNTRGDLVFCTRNATADTALTERVRLMSNGNLGIGTNNALQKLHVVGNIIATGDITAYYT